MDSIGAFAEREAEHDGTEATVLATIEFRTNILITTNAKNHTKISHTTIESSYLDVRFDDLRANPRITSHQQVLGRISKSRDTSNL